jgi:plasmid stability protein
MKNIIVTLDDETYRKARIRAAELNTSVSAVVRKYLTQFCGGRIPVRAAEKAGRSHARTDREVYG